MGFRFRKSMSLGKGVRLNVGKKSAGVSFGTRGARVSLNTSGRRAATLGIPGTGLSYTRTSTAERGRKTAASLPQATKAQADRITTLAAELSMEMGALDPMSLDRQAADDLIAALERMKVDPAYRRQMEG